MKLTRKSRPLFINNGLLKERWVIFVNDNFYKVITVNDSRAICIPLFIVKRMSADYLSEEKVIAMNKYNKHFFTISPNSEVKVYGFHLSKKEKKLK